MKNNSLELFIKIDEEEIYFDVVNFDEHNNLKILESSSITNIGIRENKILNFEDFTHQIKKKILQIEEKVNYTFKDLILILNNFNISFLNLTGFKKLNGTQISKENVTYILNSLKFNVDEYEKDKKILHIFNSKYTLDKKEIENLPIGLFGDFYSHELSFNLINKNDYKNLKNIFEKCNLKIKKILLDSFIKGSFISNSNAQIDTFYHIQINYDNSKIFYVENDSVKYEQKFNFGTKIILKDISKITALKLDVVKNIVEKSLLNYNQSNEDFVEKSFFKDHQFRKIKKKLILDISEARIKELASLFFYNNVNFKKSVNNTKLIFLEISDTLHFKCLEDIYCKSFAFNNEFTVKVFIKPDPEPFLNTANTIVQFGWKKEAIPITKSQKSFFTTIFNKIFQ